MKLYHGATEAVAKLALVEGLKPRGKRKGNWAHTVNSRTDAVYLTDIYGPYFAYSASKKNDRAAILEIDTSKLDESKFIPDEDFLEQASRGQEGWGLAAKELSMKQRTQYYRKIAEFNHDLWGKSLEHLGTVSYRGVIPPEAITRIAYVNTDSRILMEAADAMICLLNHKFCKSRYEAITKWMFGEQVTPEQFDSYLGVTLSEPGPMAEMFKGRREQVAALLANRAGVQVQCTATHGTI